MVVRADSYHCGNNTDGTHLARAPYLLTLLLVGCADSPLMHVDVTGCYAVEWNTDDDTGYLSLKPDSIFLSSAQYSVPDEIAEHVDAVDFRKASLVRRPRVTADGEVFWEDRDTWWWWRLQHDSLVFATGHDASDLMGFRVAVHGDRVSGEGVWLNDYGSDAEFSVAGRRIPCPDG